MAKKTAVKEEVKLEPSRSGFTLIGNVNSQTTLSQQNQHLKADSSQED